MALRASLCLTWPSSLDPLLYQDLSTVVDCWAIILGERLEARGYQIASEATEGFLLSCDASVMRPYAGTFLQGCFIWDVSLG